MNSEHPETGLIQNLIQHCAVINRSPRASTNVRIAALKIERHLAAWAKMVPAPENVFAWPSGGVGADVDPSAECEVLESLMAQLRIYRRPKSLLDKLAEHYLAVLSARFAALAVAA